MKTYRIITDGTKFRVQRKGWWNWHTEGHAFGYVGFRPHEFPSKQAALDYILRKHVVDTPEPEWKVVAA